MRSETLPPAHSGLPLRIHIPALLLTILVTATSAHAQQTVITFDEFPVGTIVTTQYPQVTFSSTAGEVVVIRSDYDLGSSPPNYICTSSSLTSDGLDCTGTIILTFKTPADNLHFLALGSNRTGSVAEVVVYTLGIYAGAVSIPGNALFGTPIPVDLSSFHQGKSSGGLSGEQRGCRLTATMACNRCG
jgi:hypothetical protein